MPNATKEATTMVCNICNKPAERPYKRTSADGRRLSEACVCTCHDAHITAGLHSQFVMLARKQGVTGVGVGYGSGVCGRSVAELMEAAGRLVR